MNIIKKSLIFVIGFIPILTVVHVTLSLSLYLTLEMFPDFIEEFYFYIVFVLTLILCGLLNKHLACRKNFYLLCCFAIICFFVGVATFKQGITGGLISTSSSQDYDTTGYSSGNISLNAASSWLGGKIGKTLRNHYVEK